MKYTYIKTKELRDFINKNIISFAPPQYRYAIDTPSIKHTETKKIYNRHRALQKKLETILGASYVHELRELLQLESLINKREQKHDNK